MTNLMKTSALIALLTAAPIAGFAGGTPTQTSSPQASVATDPEEMAEDNIVTNGSVVATTESGSPELAVDEDEDEAVAMGSSDTEGTIADELPTNSPQVSSDS